MIFKKIVEIIENRKFRAGAFANREVTLMYWEIGQYINSVILDYKRAEYGKQIVSTLSTQLMAKYGKSFELRNLRRMMQFATEFNGVDTVDTIELVACNRIVAPASH
jgi:hypothetical protein